MAYLSREIINSTCEYLLFILLFNFCRFALLIYNTRLVKVVSYTLICAACLRLVGLISLKSPLEKLAILTSALISLYWGSVQCCIIVIIYLLVTVTYASYEENRKCRERGGYELLKWDLEKGYGTISESNTPQDKGMDMGGCFLQSFLGALFMTSGHIQLILISPASGYSALETEYATWVILLVQCMAGSALCFDYGASKWDLGMFYLLITVFPKVAYISKENGDGLMSAIPALLSILAVWLIGNSIKAITALKES